MPGRELYEYRHPDPVVAEPKVLYDSFRVVYANAQTPALSLGAGTVDATLALLDRGQVKQVWAVKDGCAYLVA